MPPRPLFTTPPATVQTGGRKLSCPSCGLYRTCLSPMIEPFGSFDKELMLIGEGPGETEDKRGKPWQGKAGNLLRNTLDEFDIDLVNDCISLNAVNCRPPSNRAPTPHEI